MNPEREDDVTPNTPEDSNDAFSAAFDEATENDGPKPGEPPADEPPADELPADEPPADEPPAGEPPAPPIEEPPAPPANPDSDPNSATWEQRYKTLQGMFKAEVAREVSQQLNNRKADEPPADKAMPADTPEADEDEDEQALNEAMQDFPQLMRAVNGLVKKEVDRVRAEYAPVVNTVASDARERHFAAIRSAHGDFDEVKGRLADWVNEQPAYLQPGYKAVLSGGTTEDVIDLVSRYKQQKGVRAPEPTPTQPNDTSRRQAEAAEVVRTRGAPLIPRGEPDKDDYDAAFDEAVSRS